MAASEMKFSQQLEAWLKEPGAKTIGELNNVFAEKTFSIALMLLLAPSALPLPTGGVTNVLELIAILLSFEMIVGRRTVWLPNSLLNRHLSGTTEKKTIPFIIRRIRWFEKFSRPRLRSTLDNRLSTSFVGVFFLIFTLAAFLAPPFSGLDTLPSLGVVIIALGITLSDIAVVFLGVMVGSIGVGVIVALSSVVFDFFRRLIT